MSRKLTNMLCAYTDLRDRYGSDDPGVQQLALKVQQLERQTPVLPLGERRKNPRDQKTWNDRTFQGVGARR